MEPLLFHPQVNRRRNSLQWTTEEITPPSLHGPQSRFPSRTVESTPDPVVIMRTNQRYRHQQQPQGSTFHLHVHWFHCPPRGNVRVIGHQAQSESVRNILSVFVPIECLTPLRHPPCIGKCRRVGNQSLWTVVIGNDWQTPFTGTGR